LNVILKTMTLKPFKHSAALCTGLCAALSLALLAACSPQADKPASATPATPGAAPANVPPVSVSTVAVVQQDLPIVISAIGSITPVASVDVKAQLSGLVSAVHVREGQFVKAGDLLFTLDARADEANVAKVKAQLLKDEAALADARRQLARSRDLLAQNFVSQGAVDTSQTLVDSQIATVAADQAALDAAKVSLSYTRVKAPGTGRLGAIPVFPGTAVQANVTPMVTITQLDPIDVSFNLPQRYLNDALTALKTGDAPVTATLPENKGKLTGRLSFVDNTVDLATGTVKVKARYDNKDAKLWPGAFVNVSLTASVLKDAVVIPTATIIQTARGTIVYVAQNGKAALRPVKTLATQGENSAVSGVDVGDRVVFDGRQNLRPDSPLVERQATPPAKAATPAAPAAAADKDAKSKP
jgi:RND family efflux transporter MFP subunit